MKGKKQYCKVVIKVSDLATQDIICESYTYDFYAVGGWKDENLFSENK